MCCSPERGAPSLCIQFDEADHASVRIWIVDLRWWSCPPLVRDEDDTELVGVDDRDSVTVPVRVGRGDGR